jgi:hypothetical protein
MQGEPVYQSGGHGLPDDARAAHDVDQFVPGRLGDRVTAVAIPSVTKVNVVRCS